MDHEEALKVARVIIHADGGCSSCIGDLMQRCQILFPMHDWWSLVLEVLDRDEPEYKLAWESKEDFLASVEVGVNWEDKISVMEGK